MGRFRKIIQKSRLLTRKVIIIPIIIYRYTISPVLGPRCRFYPSCSRYSIDAIVRFGILYGLFLSIKRLLKCHPCHQGGFDPVPEIKQEGSNK
ncbi:MAG: membrane protein insertion efficiency factor YidD [Gammaproteobacteria bacterium]|nr:MAG: membrane protein insertion efficiency factor YidD [Gammaproteobacteria bacterium]UTW42568.1 membrane protein insertion efficiency factor YidD [bacterium SCSIO 12844]